MRRLVIDYGALFNRIALMENDTLVELYIENLLNKSLVGNIYLGRVVNVVDSISAAFIDIGLEKNAYLPLKGKEKCSGEILVQVKKDPIHDKGPSLTRDLSISGTYVVLLPNQSEVMVSKKIQMDPDIISKVKDRLNPMGCVLRTESKNQPLEVILDEIDLLLAKWEEIEKSNRRIVNTRLLYHDFAFETMIEKDFLPLVDEVVINKAEKKPYYNHAGLTIYSDHQPIFEAYNIEGQIEKSLQRTVLLHQGSHITFDETEALTAVDVNSGHYIGSHNKEETFLQVNLAAAKEIAKQLRLRNISGMILIDFINMSQKENYKVLLDNLNKYFKRDRSVVTIHGVTNLGLVEITRRKNRKSLKYQLLKSCDTCGGGGYVLSLDLYVKNLEDKLLNLKHHTGSHHFIIQGSHLLYNFLKGAFINDISYIKVLEEALEVSLLLLEDSSLANYEFKTSVDKSK
jgi:ribonuclease G